MKIPNVSKYVEGYVPNIIFKNYIIYVSTLETFIDINLITHESRVMELASSMLNHNDPNMDVLVYEKTDPDNKSDVVDNVDYSSCSNVMVAAYSNINRY